MNVDTAMMEQYANFLEDHASRIVELCNQLEGCLQIAVQCMDQDSGRAAAVRMGRNMENIKSNIRLTSDACQRLVLSKSHIDSATRVFGR